MKTAFLTGASGYLGGHVARTLLAKGWRVVALCRPGSSLSDDLAAAVVRVDYDGTSASISTALAAERVDVVLHLAAAVVGVHGADQVDAIIDANVRMPTHLLEAMRRSDCRRIVNTGTFWQYCNTDDYSPVNLYAATKQAFEDIAQAYVVNDAIRICTLILFDTYGIDDTRRKIVRLLVDAIDSSTPLDLSPGDQILDLTDAADVADAFVLAAERMLEGTGGECERFGISGTRLSLKELVECTRSLAQAPLNVRLGTRPYRDREIMVPIDSLPTLPGWTTRQNLDDVILAMLAARRGT